jgi:chromosome segregation ATPase
MNDPRTLASRAAALAMLLALAACAPGDCDPNNAELFTGIGCAAGGGYRARETTLRDSLAASQARELESQAAATRASADEANARMDLDARRRQLAILDGRLQQLSRQVEAARHRRDVDQTALRRAEANLEALRARRAQLPAQPSQQQLHDLEGSTRALGETLDQAGAH